MRLTYTCSVCSGSGEGRYEGSRCYSCKGTGEEVVEDNDDGEDESADEDDDA